MEGSTEINSKHTALAREAGFVLTEEAQGKLVGVEAPEALEEVSQLRRRIESLFDQHGEKLSSAWDSRSMRKAIRKSIDQNNNQLTNDVRQEFEKYTSVSDNTTTEVLLRALRYKHDESAGASQNEKIRKAKAAIRGWFRDRSNKK